MTAARKGTTGLSENAKKCLNRYVSETMQRAGIPGLSLTLTRGGNALFSRGFGYRDLESRKPATENTLYGVGSVTKSFTALAILQLEEKGLLNLSDSVTDYAGSFKIDEHASKTTISHLLSHSSGMPSLNVAEIILFKDIGTDTSFIPITGYEDFFNFLNESSGERHSPPGNKFLYWNEGYTILGKIIEDLTKMTYAQYIEENLLKPLGMKRSVFSRDKALADADHAIPYYRSEDGNYKPTEIPDGQMVLAPGGLLTSPVELSRYLGLWIGGDHSDSAILSRKRLEEAIEPRITASITGAYGKTFYGYGWMKINDFFGKSLVMHSGSVAASSGFVGFVPDLNIGVSIGSNCSDAPTTQIGMYALALLIEGANPDELPFLKIKRLKERLKGDYEDYRGYSKVRVSDGQDGLLNISIESDENHMTLPVLFDGEEVYTMVNDFRMPLEVRFGPAGRTEIYFERHRFLKR